MECKDIERVLHRLIDSELPPAIKSDAEAHVAGCAPCGPLVAAEQQWREAVRRDGTYYTAPEAVRRSIEAMARRQSLSRARSAWPGWRVAASLLVVVGLTSAVTAYVATPSSTALMEDQVVASHVRSLQMDHITDVASSDEHTVKPWFHGKLDYAPPVEDYTAEGFPLIGGRLEYLDHQNVAALVYRRARHPINVFVFPHDAADSAPQFTVDHGYNMWRWTKGGMAFWAVSDVNNSDLAKLVELLREQKRDGTPDQ